MNEETEKANAYVYISPVVFTKAFFELSVAAKKLFLDIAMQQHSETTLKRSLDKQDERGNRTHFGGMYRFLHKKYPHQIRAVMTELTTALPCTGTPLFKICKLQKGVKNKKDIRLYIYPYIRISYVQKKQEKYSIAIHSHQSLLMLVKLVLSNPYYKK